MTVLRVECWEGEGKRAWQCRSLPPRQFRRRCGPSSWHVAPPRPLNSSPCKSRHAPGDADKVTSILIGSYNKMDVTLSASGAPPPAGVQFSADATDFAFPIPRSYHPGSKPGAATTVRPAPRRFSYPRRDGSYGVAYFGGGRTGQRGP